MSHALQLKEKTLRDCDELLKRLEGLLGHHGKVAEEIHAIRKLGKKIRGALLGLDAPKPARHALTSMARMFAAQRDAVSRHTTWRRLKLPAGTAGASAPAIAALLVAEEKAASRRVPAEAVAWAREWVGQARGQLVDMSDDGLDEAMARGQCRLRRRLLKRLEKSIAKPLTASRLHDLRKAVKASLGGGEKSDLLENLAEVLGDDNDLSVLEVWLEAHGFHPWNASAVFRQIDAKHQKLRGEILKGARHLLEKL